MKVLETVFDIIEQGLGVCFVLLMFISVLLQIFYRYVLQSPLTWKKRQLAIVSYGLSFWVQPLP